MILGSKGQRLGLGLKHIEGDRVAGVWMDSRANGDFMGLAGRAIGLINPTRYPHDKNPD